MVEEVSKHAQLVDFVLLPKKSYCFLRFNSKTEAQHVEVAMNGLSELGQKNSPLLMSYCNVVPAVEHRPWLSKLPEGLILIEDCIDSDTEAELLKNLQWDWEDDGIEGKLKNRKVQHFGFEFLYGSNNVDPNCPLSERPIPETCSEIWKNLEKNSQPFRDFRPDQLTVNRYEPGHGIPAHCDTHSCFENPIISLSLASSAVMEFRKPETLQHASVLLPRRSLLIMSGESRYGWTHAITGRRSDIIVKPDGKLTVQKRDVRVSFTFRKLKIPPSCMCSFPTLCDVAKSPDSAHDETTVLEVTDQVAAKLEIENVHKVYNEIGSHFSETRHSPWPNVENFIKGLHSGAILLDVGCGNGKYLRINESILKMGCDRSDSLLQVCTERKFNVFQCDCLEIPLRDESVDAVSKTFIGINCII